MGDMADMYSDYFDCEDDQPHEATCKYCHKDHLLWEMTPAGWRLFEAGELHVCIDPFKLIVEVEHANHVVETGATGRRVRRPAR